jgi:hypothetical protein
MAPAGHGERAPAASQIIRPDAQGLVAGGRLGRCA